MSQIRLSLATLSLDQKIQLARDIVGAMTGNGAFPTPNPALAAITASANAAQAALTDQRASQQAAQLATIAARNAEGSLDAGLTTLAAYVQNASGGDAAKIISAGMDVKSSGGPVGPLPAPQALSATTGDLPGEVDLHWSRVPGAVTYVSQVTPDPLTPASTWTNLPPSTKSKCTAEDLTPGTRYWFRVAAVGSAGQGPWSEPATKMAQA